MGVGHRVPGRQELVRALLSTGLHAAQEGAVSAMARVIRCEVPTTVESTGLDECESFTNAVQIVIGRACQERAEVVEILRAYAARHESIQRGRQSAHRAYQRRQAP
jgi:hypothetical protein